MRGKDTVMGVLPCLYGQFMYKSGLDVMKDQTFESSIELCHPSSRKFNCPKGNFGMAAEELVHGSPWKCI